VRTLGLLGGMSWESTLPYYRVINEAVRARLGGQHSARLVLYSVDFAEVERMQREQRWDDAAALLVRAGAALERAGAEALVLCTNTMHRVAPQLERELSIPLLHIVDATADALRPHGFARVALLGTRFTMEQSFYVGRLRERLGCEVLVPDEPDRSEVHRVIYDELCQGIVRAKSRDAYLGAIERLRARGAQAVVLGCTEISLLVAPERVPCPAFDSTRIHAEAAADWALAAR
jgi:aspartate racemase